MNESVRQALGHGGTIDITTIGRKTGLPRRIEIVFHNFDGWKLRPLRACV
jgi:hypothetical protein